MTNKPVRRRRVLLLRIASLVALASMLAGCVSTGPVTRAEGHRIAGRTYVILGASSGFGRGVASELGAHSANVVVAARRTDLLEEVAAETRARGGQALVVTADAANPEDVERLARDAVARFGRIDVWVNIAGVGVIGRFWEIPVADHARTVDVNLKGVIYGSYAALRQFHAQGRGVLVNMGSIEAEIPLAYHASYASTKAGILALDRSLNEELRLSGLTQVKVATVMPWAVDTPFWTHAGNYSGGTPRMALMDDPGIVVNAILRASLYPREEAPVGWKAVGANWAHHLAPDLTERMAADVVQHYQIDTAPPTPNTAGSLYEPMQEGRGVDGGARARMSAEDAARKASQPEAPP
jgi:short-subunit dehydrogenase